MTIAERTKALDQIAEEIRACKICQKDTVGIAVPGEGSPKAKVVFIGEAPGKNEAETGRPFIGRSGKLLREKIRAAGLKEEDVFITSACKYLPKHVTPTPAEVEHGRIHLNAQLEIIKPKILVLLGRTAALSMLGHEISIGKEHGKVLNENGRTFFLAYHPAAALYSPGGKIAFEGDMKKLAEFLITKESSS